MDDTSLGRFQCCIEPLGYDHAHALLSLCMAYAVHLHAMLIESRIGLAYLNNRPSPKTIAEISLYDVLDSGVTGGDPG